MAASASSLIPLLPKWLRTRDFFRFRHVTDDKISASVAFHFLGSLLKRLLIQRTFSGSMGMNCNGQKEISMLRKLSLVVTLAAALALPTVAAAWDGHGGGWGGGGHHGGWGGGGWDHGGGGGSGGWGRGGGWGRRGWGGYGYYGGYGGCWRWYGQWVWVC